MFLIKINKIVGVKQFLYTNSSNLYFVKGERIRERTVYYEDEEIIEKTKVYSLVQAANGIFINTKNYSYFFDKNKELKKFEKKIYKGELNNSFVFERIDKTEPVLIFYNIKEDAIFEMGESSSILHFYNDSLYKVLFDENLTPSTIVKMAPKGTHWQFNFKDLNSKTKDLRIKKIIGILNTELWIALNNHMVISIDIVNGNLLKQISKINVLKCDWLPPSIPAPEAMQIDPSRNCLVGFMWEFYWEIDPLTGKIDFFDLSEYFKNEKIRNDKPDFVLGKNHIYFISRHDSKIGALNRETKKLDWVHTFTKNEQNIVPEILEIKGDDNILGALDRSNTLHIFQKQ